MEFKESVDLDVKKITSLFPITLNYKVSISFHYEYRQQAESVTVINRIIDLFVSHYDCCRYTNVLFMPITYSFEIMIVATATARSCYLVR